MATKKRLSEALAVAAIGASSAAAVAVDGSDYDVISPLDHNQEHFSPGSTVTLTDSQAATLLALGVVAAAATVVDDEPQASDPVVEISAVTDSAAA